MDIIVDVVLEIIASVVDYKASKKNKKQTLTKTETSNDILITKPKDINDEKMLEKLEFQTLLLTYMMNEDDGKISSSERKIIINHLNQFRSLILVKFARMKKLTEEDINEGIRLLKLIDQEEYHYSEIINRITSRFVIEIEFM